MKIEIAEHIWITNAKEESIEDLKDILRYNNPLYGFAQSRNSKFQYGDIPPKYIWCFVEIDGRLGVPVGFGLDKIKKIAKTNKELVVVKDKRSDGYNIDFNINFNDDFKEFEAHQIKIIDKVCEITNGVVSSPTGSGKTISTLGIINALKVSTLIIVDTVDLVTQWENVIKENTSGRFKLGVYSGSRKVMGDVTVATVQTLKNLSDENIELFKDKFGLVITDECHCAAAPTFVSVNSMFTAKRKIGLSATPYRKDKCEFVFKNYIGDIVLKISDDEVQDIGRIVPMRYQMVNTGYELNYDDIDQTIELFPDVALRDYGRLKFVTDMVLSDLENDYSPLVISHRTSHIMLLMKALQAEDVKVAILIGKVPKKNRETIIKDVKNGLYDVLIANEKIFGKGMDIPKLDSVHVPFYTTNKSLLKQISGRVRRKYKNKEFARLTYYTDKVYTVRKKPNGQVFKTPAESFTNAYSNVEKFFKSWAFQKIENESKFRTGI